MSSANELQVSLAPYLPSAGKEFDLDRIIFDLDGELAKVTSQADAADYIVSIASGLLCGVMDILWVGDFSLERGRNLASDKVDGFVTKTAKLLGYDKDDVNGAVKFLEGKFPLASDGNTPNFGGGLQHHLRDFAHHPTIVGLAFSLLTQFTEMSYGTDTAGKFLVVPVPEKSKAFIGKDVPTKILYGTFNWFFHLVSDVAGSSSTAGKGGGTGIPGPILALAKELATLPAFKDVCVGEYSLSLFLSKLFNGTLLAQHDENGKIIKDTVLKFDLRGEFGVALELGRQAVPVVANECIVRGFYFIRRFIQNVRETEIHCIADFQKIPWKNVIPANNPTIARMLTIATGVFTAVDIGEAIATQKYWVAVNYVGVGRFAVAIGEDISWGLKARDIKKLKEMYEDIKRNSYRAADERVYERMGDAMDFDKMGLTVEQTELLYNLECKITEHDIYHTPTPLGNYAIYDLKRQWLNEWKKTITDSYASFLEIEGAQIRWYSSEELLRKISEQNPKEPWFRLVLLEAMLFEPYYTLSVEKDKKGNLQPSKKYNALHAPLVGFNKKQADEFLESLFIQKSYYTKGYIKRLRKTYSKVLAELNEVLKAVLTGVVITAAIVIITVITAGLFAPKIAVLLVGSKFVGLSGQALINACLAFLGGGAVAAGGSGIAGGTAVIIGGGAILGTGVGSSVGGAVSAASVRGKKDTILMSAKLLVAVREIFLNDEKDISYSNSIYEQYVKQIKAIEDGLTELRLKANVATGKEKSRLKKEIKRAEESVEAMKIAQKSMHKFTSSFSEGMGV